MTSFKLQVFEGSVDEFAHLVRINSLTSIMAANYENKTGSPPSPKEQTSWQNSLPRVKNLIEIAGLSDNRILLEYEVPYNQGNRIDCLLFGKDRENKEHAVLIELKQWTKVIALEDEGNFRGVDKVQTDVGRKDNIVPHPSQQAKGYEDYLKGFLEVFDQASPLFLFSCAYCHNYKRIENEGLFAPVYQKLVDAYPIYTEEDTVRLGEKLKELLSGGRGTEVLNRFMLSRVKHAKKLLEHVEKVIKNEEVFSLLNEQLVAKNMIWSKARKADKSKKKSVIIVHGGPGTGKSLIALNVLAEAASKAKKVFYGCKSKPFTEGLKHLVGRDGEILFSNLYRFLPTRMDENELDLLLIDEAHRIEKTSNFQYTKPEDRTDMPQVEQLIRCSKTTVFFIDDKQSVRSQEIGNSELIRTTADHLNCTLSEITLETQFRCMGSNDYLLWLESVFGYSKDKKILARDEVYDFKIMDSPQAVYDAILAQEKQKTNSARMVAGFCWPWSKTLDKKGDFVKDIIIGDFAMPWETHGDIKPPKGYVKWYEWAYKPEGVKQVGCIYTAQGFEFEYIGVIVGNDLIYDEDTDGLKADFSATRDPTLKRSRERFEEHVKNIYRVLMTRGMKGCYVYFTNKETEKFFRSRME